MTSQTLFHSTFGIRYRVQGTTWTSSLNAMLAGAFTYRKPPPTGRVTEHADD